MATLPIRCYASGMRATTVKLDGELLRDLREAKPAKVPLTMFVRALLERELGRMKHRVAAERYATLLREDSVERAWLEEWDAADLAAPLVSALRPTQR